jgi:predicted Zn-dependent protease
MARLIVTTGVKAQDGEGLARMEQRFARTPDGLPDEAVEKQMIDQVATELAALHDAPVADTFVGPAILQGRAAGVFFHEVFGHRIEGHRQKDKTSGRTFSSKVGERIMPEWLSVYDDPTLTRLNGNPLVGFYRFDDEGVRASRASLVKDGVLEGFVMGRNPIPGFANSNGHGRKQLGTFAVSRQGNTVVEATRTVPDDKLVEQLIAEVKRQGTPYGMIFTDISGGFTQTSTFEPQSFKVHPTMAYRVYPDGKRKLVRGVDIVGTPLTALGSIISAGRSVETFNGTCGAESGWVPVSASAPSLLV